MLGLQNQRSYLRMGKFFLLWWYECSTRRCCLGSRESILIYCWIIFVTDGIEYNYQIREAGSDHSYC